MPTTPDKDSAPFDWEAEARQRGLALARAMGALTSIAMSGCPEDRQRAIEAMDRVMGVLKSEEPDDD